MHLKLQDAPSATRTPDLASTLEVKVRPGVLLVMHPAIEDEYLPVLSSSRMRTTFERVLQQWRGSM